MFKPRIFRNALTEKIENDPELTLVDILLHKEFYPTIRNESDILYKRILSKKDKWFSEILNYALFGLNPPEKYANDNKIRQVNHNASNFLEGCGKKFMTYLKKTMGPDLIESSDLQKLLRDTIKSFISAKNDINQDRMLAGHFQRFIENFIRWKAFGDNPSDSLQIINQIIPFLIKNCRILAYQQLITRILCDFTGTIDDATMYSLFNQMLYLSCQSVKYIISQTADQPKNCNGLHPYDYKKNEQPFNLMKEPLPLLQFDFSQKNSQADIVDDINIQWEKEIQVEIHFDSIEDAEMQGYLLIMSIRSSVYERLDIINIFREEKNNNYRLIQSLLYCGIFSNVNSLISLEAFRLLDIIFNGLSFLDINPWLKDESEKLDKLDFYPKFAEKIIFDPKNPNLKIIRSLPIFWNHRYNIKEYKMSEEELKEYDVSDYYQKKQEKTRKREKGETPFEILQPCLLAEPPISSSLINSYVSIFIHLLKERKELRENNDHSNKTLDSMVRLDGTLIDFYRHHFNFSNQEVKFSDLFNTIIPLPSDDAYFAEEVQTSIRAPLNGFVLDFILRMLNPNENTFFDVDDDLFCTSISHCNEIKAIDNKISHILAFKDHAYLDALSENAVFNISINDNYYGDDEEEDEDNDQRPRHDIYLVK